MSNPESLFQATINRLKIRFEEKLLDIASKVSILLENSPERLNDEWELFKEEVYAEAERIDKKKTNTDTANKVLTNQERVDRIREKVSTLSKFIETNN